MPESRTSVRRRVARRALVVAARAAVVAASLVVALHGTAAAGSDDVEETPATVAVPTWDEPAVDEGAVTIVGIDRQPISNGGSSTAYSLELPDGAACPGDTASGNWYVQGFLIPVGDDPGAIRYGVMGPEGTQFPLFAYDTRPYAHQVTQVSSRPDDPGIIAAIPELTFRVFEPGYVPPGQYRIGVACTYFRQTARYWDTEIVIEADPADTPAQLTWRLPDAASFDPSSVEESSTTRWPLIALIMGAGLLVAWLLLRSPSSQHEEADGDDFVRAASASADPVHPDELHDPSRSPR